MTGRMAGRDEVDSHSDTTKMACPFFNRERAIHCRYRQHRNGNIGGGEGHRERHGARLEGIPIPILCKIASPPNMKIPMRP